MPSKAEHISKAEHNENFATTLNSDGSYPDYRDWVVTAYFYSAVHYVEAYLATLGKHSPDHRIRDADIGSDASRLPRFGRTTPPMLVIPCGTRPLSPVTNAIKPGHEAIKAHLLSIIS